MKISQRLAALLTSILLLISMLPVSAAAEAVEGGESFDAFVDSVPETPADTGEVFGDSFVSDGAESFGAAPTPEPESEATAEQEPEVEATTEPEVEDPAEPTQEPELTTEPTPVPEAEPTAEPETDVTAAPAVTPTPETTAEVSAEKAAFVPGLARISVGVRLYEHKGLWGSYSESAGSGVVYAAELSEDEKAVRIVLNNGTCLWEGWVSSGDVRMLTEEQTSAYDQDTFNEETDRIYKAHTLRVIELRTSEPTEAPAAATPEPVFDAFVPVLTPEPVDVPASDASSETAVPETTPAPAETPAATEEEVFVEFVPEVTVEPLPEPSFEPEDTQDAPKFVEYRALQAPGNLSATHNRNGKMTLSWTGTSDADAYQVLYKASGQTEYSLLAQTDKTYYSTSSLNPAIVYYFRVQGVQLDSNGAVLNASPHSATYPYIVLGDAKIDDPRGKDSSTIRLTWSAVAGANLYDVMMSIHGQNEWSIVRTNLTGTLCDIANISFDETYDFRVIPKRKLSSGQIITGNSSRVLMVGSPMETPSFQEYDWTPVGLRLTWDEIPGASGYVIYRRAFSETDVTNYTKLVVLDEPVTSYTDTSMTPGEVYYYFVYSFKTCQPEGWRCFSLKGEIGMGTWLPDAANMVCEDMLNQGVRISWPAVTGASHYDVSISTTQGYMPTGNGNGRVSNPSGYHSTAQLGVTYYYRVRPLRIFSNGDVSYGQWSEEFSHTYSEAKPTYRALAIGNTYPNQTDYLPGCDNDARAMGYMLSNMTGTPYTVSVQLNLSDSGMINAIRTTFADAESNDVSLLYFSGHGANSPDTEFHGALVGVYHTYLSVSRLKEELDKIPGKKVVIIDSCHSGQMIGKSAGEEVTSAELSAFNSLVISTFASDADTIVRSVSTEIEMPDEELFTAEPLLIARGENDLANSGYYVITAAHSTEQSVSMGYDSNSDSKIEKYFGLFTYSLCHGSGWNVATGSTISTLNADRDSNNEITLYEAYLYAKAMAQRSNPNQTAQIYPSNSAMVIWSK